MQCRKGSTRRKFASASRIKDLPGVAEVHDLHIWAMSTTKTALTAHLVTADRTAPATDRIQGANRALHDSFQIEHTTLQLETADDDGSCPQEPEDSV